MQRRTFGTSRSGGPAARGDRAARAIPLGRRAVQLTVIRPLSHLPRAGRRIRAAASSVLEVPRRSPQRQLHALRAFIRPHEWTRDAVRHRLAVDPSDAFEQSWDPQWAGGLIRAAQAAAGRLGVRVQAELPAAGEDVHLRLCFAPEVSEHDARAVALACSARLSNTWLHLGRLYVYGGRFWRRERGYRLHLRPAADVHLPRHVRARVRDLLRPMPSGGG